MMNHTKILLATCSLLAVAALAQAQVNPRYPIAELGSCRDAKECRLFCEIPANKAACWSYGEYVLHAQVRSSRSSDEELAQKHGITFPIAELGNCGSVDECQAFCDVPANQPACLAFAEKHGLSDAGEQPNILEAAQRELGCTSMQECQAFCENPANQSRCMEFAERYAPGEYHQYKNEMLQRARETLGCDSFESCQNFCNNPENIDRCMQFAEEHAPEEFKQRREEFANKLGKDLPCNSFTTCRAYCEANPDKCQQYSDNAGAYHVDVHQEESYTCNSEEECKRYCEGNPDRCPGFTQSGDYQRFQQEPQERYPQYDQYQQYNQYQSSPPSDYSQYQNYQPSDYSQSQPPGPENYYPPQYQNYTP